MVPDPRKSHVWGWLAEVFQQPYPLSLPAGSPCCAIPRLRAVLSLMVQPGLTGLAWVLGWQGWVAMVM